jgi:hypothetical protein
MFMSDCPRTEPEARQDGVRLGHLLQDANPNFLTFMDKEYGFTAQTACHQRAIALHTVMEEVQKLNSQYVQIDLPSPPPEEPGHYNGGYYNDNREVKGFRINVTNLYVSIAIDDLQSGVSPAKVNASMARSINPEDAELFTKLFKERTAQEKLPFDVTLDSARNIMIKKSTS